MYGRRFKFWKLAFRTSDHKFGVGARMPSLCLGVKLIGGGAAAADRYLTRTVGLGRIGWLERYAAVCPKWGVILLFVARMASLHPKKRNQPLGEDVM